MKLPSFLTPDADEAGGFAGAAAHVLPLPQLAAQEETNWCWAAVTQYVLQMQRNVRPAQDEIATAHIQHNGRAIVCAGPTRSKTGGTCADPCTARCNGQHTLRIVLDEQGFTVGYLSQQAAPSFADLKRQIEDFGRPVPCRVKWSTGGAHFVLVTGVEIDAESTPFVYVCDPNSAPRGQAISARRLSYQDFLRYPFSSLRGSINYSYQVT